MTHLPLSRRTLLLATAAGAFAVLAEAATRKQPATAPFKPRLYAMDTALRGPDVPTLKDKVDLLARLGYCGIDYTLDHQQLPHLLELLDERKLELNAVYLSPALEDAIDPALAVSIKRLAGRSTRIELAIRSQQLKPSDPAGDKTALGNLAHLSDLVAATGPLISLYPHAGAWVERVADGFRLSIACNRANIGTNFNLVHWKWIRQDRPLNVVLSESLPYLFAVTINGLADNRIVPLDEGNYDLKSFLALLDQAGYRGDIGLQGYGIPGRSEDQLARSMRKWHELMGT